VIVNWELKKEDTGKNSGVFGEKRGVSGYGSVGCSMGKLQGWNDWEGGEKLGKSLGGRRTVPSQERQLSRNLKKE